MSLLEVLQLIGYSMGVALPLWLSLLLARQRDSLPALERALLALAIGTGLWHTCNLFLTLYGLLGFELRAWTPLLRVVDSIAVVSITLSYSFLLHVHLHLWAKSRRRPLTRFERARVFMSYIPAVFLVASLPRIWSGVYEPMLVKLSIFVLPFGLWAAYVLGLVAATDLLIAWRSEETGERRLMYTLAASFGAIGALLIAVHVVGVGRGTILEQYLFTFANLGSLLPTALIAYHVYRYRYLELLIKESLVVASFAAVVMVVYLYVIRTMEEWLTARFQLRAGVIESLLILAFVLLAAPLRRWLDRRFQKLFAREAALYREVVTRIGAHVGRFKRLPELLQMIEEEMTRELNLRRVKILPRETARGSDNAGEVGFSNRTNGDGAFGNGTNGNAVFEPLLDEEWIARLLGEAAESGEGIVEQSPLLRERGYDLALALRRDERTVGLMLVDVARDALTPDVRSVLEVLAGQVAIAIEDCRLVEENVLLERRVARGERLAELGQMAATVAHEVKNPLSAIKSIAQVMREDEKLSAEYTRDLDLIVGETERLSRSVSQLLNFARDAPATAQSSRADDLLLTLAALFRADAQAQGIKLDCQTTTAAVLDGMQATAVRDALANLLHNALQVTPRGGRVSLAARDEPQGLRFVVEDEGVGVPLELQRRIWEPFFTTKQRGTGLGLAIVRKRMEEVGGQAQLVPPQSGKGARFELSLPCQPVANN